MTFFSNSQLGLSRSLRSNDLRWWNFEAATSKFCNHSWNFGSSTQKGKVDLCMTNGSKVMVYLTLLNLLLHYLQEYSKIWNIASQINHNFGTVCHTEVYFTFSRWGAKLLGMFAKFWGHSLKISPSEVIRPRKAQLRILKKCHGIVPFLP